MKHKVEVLSREEIIANRSNAYQFIDFDKQETALEEVILQILTENSVGEEDMILSDTFPKVVNCMNEMAKWQQKQDITANDILNYILTNDDGVGIALGYNSRQMIEQHFRNIGYDR